MTILIWFTSVIMAEMDSGASLTWPRMLEILAAAVRIPVIEAVMLRGSMLACHHPRGEAGTIEK